MILSGLLIGGGALYLGASFYQQKRRRKPLIEQFCEPRVGGTPFHGTPPRRLATDLAIGAGAIAVGSVVGMAATTGVTPLLLTNQLIALARSTPYAPVLYMAAYAARPLLLFPATLLTLAGGLLFGPVGGVVYTIIGSNLSALIAYGIGRQLRWLGNQDLEESASAHVNWQALAPYVVRMQEEPFATVLTMRFLFLPYDLVNYGAGLLNLDWHPFLLATALGSLPGTLAFVLAGASIQGNGITNVPRLNLTSLTASGLIFVGSLAFSRYLRRRQVATAALPVATPIMQS